MILQLSGAPPMSADLRQLPSHTRITWEMQLAHQTSTRTSVNEALQLVSAAVARLMPTRPAHPLASGLRRPMESAL